MLMRKLVAEVKQESLRRWTSAADSVFWVRSREQVGRKSKTEYKCVTERGAGWRVKMREAEMVSKDDFCHLGFPIQVTDSEQKRWRMRGAEKRAVTKGQQQVWEGKGLQDRSGTCHDVWFRDSVPVSQTGGWAEGGRVKDAEIFYWEISKLGEEKLEMKLKSTTDGTYTVYIG